MLYEVGGTLGVKTHVRKKEYTQLLCAFFKGKRRLRNFDFSIICLL
jgi:hypothetical protein